MNETMQKTIEKLLEKLPKRSREIIKLRFGLTDGYSYTHEELAKIFGISRQRIQQIEMRALQTLQMPKSV